MAFPLSKKRKMIATGKATHVDLRFPFIALLGDRYEENLTYGPKRDATRTRLEEDAWE